MIQIHTHTGIVHLRVETAQSLSHLLLRQDFEALGVEPTPELLERWWYLGCIFVDGVRARSDRQVEPGQTLRLHTRPKSYVASPPPDLRSRIVLDEEEFLVLDKPAGLPTHPTLDNYVENAWFMLSEQLGKPVYVTHRLDIPTEGLLVLAKSPAAQALLNKNFALKRVDKTYRALTRTPVPLGLHTHYMNPESRTPKEVSIEPREGWWNCDLEVVSCGPSALNSTHHLSTVRLLTGRTHQIRAQFSALKSPILGDQAYGANEAFSNGGIALECYVLSFPFRMGKFRVQRQAGSIA